MREPTCRFGEPDQAADTGYAAGTVLVPCASEAVTAAGLPTATVAGTVSVSSSTCGRTCVPIQSGASANQLRLTCSASALVTGSTPHSDQPVNPPSSGAVAGFLPELPLMKYGTASTWEAWKVPTCAPMNAAPLPVVRWKSASQPSTSAASLRSPSWLPLPGVGSRGGTWNRTVTDPIEASSAAWSSWARSRATWS